VGQTAYAQLIEVLGLTDSSPSNINAQFENCQILYVNFTYLQCAIERMTVPLTQADNPLLASLSLNNINPYTDFNENITVIQSLNVTPVVSCISSTTTYFSNTSSIQLTNFTLTGSLLLTEEYETIINLNYNGADNATCYYDTQYSNNSQLLVTCEDLAAGDYTVIVLVPYYGYANILNSATVGVELEIISSSFGSPIGSVGGGTEFVLRGLGFSSVCGEDSIVFQLSDSYSSVATLTACSTNEISKFLHYES